ncbi:hypothetical protein ABEW05_003057 [Botrytis cinerea]
MGDMFSRFCFAVIGGFSGAAGLLNELGGAVGSDRYSTADVVRNGSIVD